MTVRNPLAICAAFIVITFVIIALFYQKVQDPSSFFLISGGILMITFSILRIAAKFSS